LDALNSITVARVRPLSPKLFSVNNRQQRLCVCVCVCVLVLLPASALQEIVSKDVAGKQFLSDSPLVFELSNPANGKKTYAGTRFSVRCACACACAFAFLFLTFPPYRCDGVSGR
jgi:hypothetical protein